MAEHLHPIRQQEIHAYHCADAADERRWRAFFSDARAWPIYFDAPTKLGAIQRAEEWRDDVIAKNEASFAARQEALRKAREAKRRKAALRDAGEGEA